MTVLPVTSEELEELREVQIRPKWGWPAVFSCNESRRVWPRTTASRTPDAEREYLEGCFPLLDEIVKSVVRETAARGRYPLGGRFRVDDEGVELADGDERIIEFDFTYDEGFAIR